MNSTSSILKDCSKAVNQASFSPTAQRKARAVKLLAELTKSITELKTLKPKAKPKAKPKKTTAKAKPNKALSADEYYGKMTKAELIAILEHTSIGDSPSGKKRH